MPITRQQALDYSESPDLIGLGFEAAVLVASSEKAIRELGWKPRYTSLDDIIRTAWIWHQKRYSD